MRFFGAANYLSIILFTIFSFSFSTIKANEVILFGSAGCPYCKKIEAFFKSNNIEYKYHDVEDAAGYEKLLEIEKNLGIRKSGDFPAVFIRQNSFERIFYYGVGNLKDSLVKHLKIDMATKEAVVPKSTQTDSQKGVISESRSQEATVASEYVKTQPTDEILKSEKTYIIYFYEAGCPECVRISRHLDFIVSQNENVVVERHYMKEKSSILLNEILSNKHNVPDNQRLTAPSIFTRAGFLPEEKSTPFFIDSLLAISKPGIFWKLGEEDVKMAEDRIFERFQAITILTVITAGLLDGINPCAFAVLIFLISYLMVLKKDKKTVLIAGLSFTFGVFTLYFSAGLGFTVVINHLHRFDNVGNIINIAFAVFLVVFAILNLNDFFAIKNNRYDKVKLSMSNNMSKKIHEIIKKIGNTRFLFLNSFIAGFVLSLFELACTGQVYLPTIIYMREVAPEQSLFLLLLFNLMFVTPILLVFLLVYKGVTASTLQKFMLKNAGRVKLGFFFLFIFMAVGLVLSTIFFS